MGCPYLRQKAEASPIDFFKSEKLKKAVTVSEERNPGAFPKAGPIFQQPFSLPESAQTLAGIASSAAGKSGKNFPAASKFAGKPFQQGLFSPKWNGLPLLKQKQGDTFFLTASQGTLCAPKGLLLLHSLALYLRLKNSDYHAAEMIWKKGKDPHPQDKIQHLDFNKDPRPLYYKTPPYVFYHHRCL